MAVFSDHKPMRVLLVEDDADIAENIGDYLEDKGHIIENKYREGTESPETIWQALLAIFKLSFRR